MHSKPDFTQIELTEEELSAVSGGSGISRMLCPNCTHEIYYSIEELLMGKVFICTNCNERISLGQSSQEKVSDALRRYEEIKKKEKQQGI